MARKTDRIASFDLLRGAIVALSLYFAVQARFGLGGTDYFGLLRSFPLRGVLLVHFFFFVSGFMAYHVYSRRFECGFWGTTWRLVWKGVLLLFVSVLFASFVRFIRYGSPLGMFANWRVFFKYLLVKNPVNAFAVFGALFVLAPFFILLFRRFRDDRVPLAAASAVLFFDYYLRSLGLIPPASYFVLDGGTINPLIPMLALYFLGYFFGTHYAKAKKTWHLHMAAVALASYAAIRSAYGLFGWNILGGVNPVVLESVLFASAAVLSGYVFVRLGWGAGVPGFLERHILVVGRHSMAGFLAGAFLVELAGAYYDFGEFSITFTRGMGVYVLVLAGVYVSCAAAKALGSGDKSRISRRVSVRHHVGGGVERPLSWWFVGHERLVVAVLLLCFVGLGVSSSLRKTETATERFDGLGAGLRYLKSGQLKGENEGPVLMKAVAAIPLLALDDGTISRFGRMNKVEFMSRILVWGRLPIILLGAIGGLLVYLWARELYGVKSGFVALFLYSFCPNIIAHSSLATADWGVAFFYLASLYCLYRFLQGPSRWMLVIAGVMLGLSQAAGYAGILLYPMFIICAACYWLNGGGGGFSRRPVLDLAAIFVVSVLALDSVYLFRDCLTPLGGRGFESAALKALGGSGVVGSVPLPLPAAYLQGLDGWLARGERGQRAFLLGEERTTGWWQYYAVAYLVKTPIPSILLFAAALALSFGKKPNGRGEFFLLLPAFALLAYMSFVNNADVGLKDVLPAFPLIYVYSGRIMALRLGEAYRHLAGFIVGLMLFWVLCGTLAVWPLYLSYFNEFVGGPDNGHTVLGGSNVGWGQDDFYLWQFVNANRKATASVNPGCVYTSKTVVVDVNSVQDSFVVGGGGCYDWLVNNYPVLRRLGQGWWVYYAPKPHDSVRFDNDTGFQRHGGVCAPKCQRPDGMHYLIKNSSFDFSMNVSAGREYLLMVDVVGGGSCKTMDVRVDGVYVGTIDGMRPKRIERSVGVKLPPRLSSGEGYRTVRVSLSHFSDDCGGWRVGGARMVETQKPTVYEHQTSI